MGLYWPNFSLVFLIHLFLYAGVNCILDIFKVNSLYIAKFMFSYHRRLLPTPFLNLFLTGGQIHNYDTRISAHFRPHTCRTNIMELTVLFRGPEIWNALPLSPSKDSFLISSVNRMKRPTLLCLNSLATVC